MTTYALFLRAVNVGGTGKLPMASLRALLTKLRYEGVATYIQSGNAVVVSGKSADAVATEVERALAKSFDLETRVMVRSHADLAKLVAAGHPFGDAPPNRVHVVFLSAAPSKSAIAALDPHRSPPDVYVVRGRELHWHTPDGAGQSKVSMPWLEKQLGVSGTARNWNTVMKMSELTKAR